MRKKRLGQWMLLAIICLSFSVGETYAQKHEFANYRRYATGNTVLTQPVEKEKRAVFMDSSITEEWVRTHPDFFKMNGYIGHGISSQTSYQFSLRFREDVINLFLILVVINAGINDVAENIGAYNEDYTFGNIVSMTEPAKTSRIKAILTSVLPAAEFPWRREIKDAPQKIQSLDTRIEAYAKANKVPFMSYYQPMVVGDNKILNPQYMKDGVCPTGGGCNIMEASIKQAIERAL